MAGCDMIANLNRLPEPEWTGAFKIKRAISVDKEKILRFVGEQLHESWIPEVETAIFLQKCYIATLDGNVVGFACYDATAKGFFGPIGVAPDLQGQGVGRALLLKTLEAMKYEGYGYAIIGWVDEAAPFYEKCVCAQFIPGGEPENSVYSNLVWM